MTFSATCLVFLALGVSTTTALVRCSLHGARKNTFIYAMESVVACGEDNVETVHGCLVKHLLDDKMTSVIMSTGMLKNLKGCFSSIYPELKEDGPLFDFTGDKKYTQCGIIQKAVTKGGDEKFSQVMLRVQQYLETFNATLESIKTLPMLNSATEADTQNDESHNGDQTLSRKRRSTTNTGYSSAKHMMPLVPEMPIIQNISLCDIKMRKDAETYIVHTDMSMHKCPTDPNSEEILEFETLSNTSDPRQVLLCGEPGLKPYLFDKWTARDSGASIISAIKLPIRMHECFREKTYYGDEYDDSFSDY